MSEAKPDREAFFKALMAAMIAFMIWSLLTRKVTPPQDGNDGATQARVADTLSERFGKVPEGYVVLAAPSEVLLDLGNVENASASDYRIHLQLGNQGASVVSAWLTDHHLKVDARDRYQILTPVVLSAGAYCYSFTTSSINIADEFDIFLGKQLWNSELRETPEGQQAVFWLDVQKDEQDFVRVIKTYTLNKQNSDDAHNALAITLGFENRSEESVRINSTQLGPVGVPEEDPRTDNRKISVGVRESGSITLIQQQVTKLTPKLRAEPLFRQTDPQMVWLALANKFFGVIVAPEQSADEQAWVISVDAVKLTADEEEKNDATYELVTAAIELAPGQSVSRELDCYLGPKSKPLFTTDQKYVARNYVELINQDYYWCAFSPIVNVMLWLLNTAQKFLPFHNYGVAIIIMVLIVRTLLHPLTKKGQVNMTRMAQQMSVLQPKMEEIKSKYGNDKQRMNQETMKLYQEYNINPAAQMLTCLPMMCQMPIWGALWAALNFTVELRHQPFIWWIKDLTAPDALYTFSEPVFLLGDSLNILPPLLGVGMWLQQRLMPKPAAATRQASKTSDQMTQQRMMMTFMSILMVVIFYRAPSGLTLYIMASNFFGLFEQFRIRQHLKEEEERGDKQPPAGPEASSQRFQKPKFWEKLEKLAEEAKKQR
jgi:YidC/Oxa1 family membrane protein insertase